ncbi:MAG: Fic family protein [Nanoarchaeota archaeon]|nr:Fic family protein [Nanoarchaeota archaeon]MBU1632722.1 Fic family protein [Nanoarchaeota archaeon]MBU1876267.1 Fic family protein [Nanoarchaeota archaeon]
MFIEIRKRDKNKKYYLIHTYRENGKVKRVSRYLGTNLNEDKLEKLREVAEHHILEEIKERSILEFELTKEEIAEFKKYDRDIEVKHLQTLNWKRFTEDFTYNTNAIEGSTVALSEVKELLSGKEEPQDADDIETLNVAKTVEYIKKSKEKITVELIINLHLICFKGTKKFAGKLRDVEVVIKDSQGNIVHQGAPINKVKGLLEELCKWYDKHKKKYPPLLLAAVMHNQFEKIHPFQDGNGRVGRLLLNYVLIHNKYPPINIKLRDRMRYYKCLQEYDKKNDIKSTLKFLISQYKKQF